MGAGDADYGTGSTDLGTGGTSSTTETAKEQAGAVAQSATESTKQVAGTAKQEAAQVLEQGRQQVRGLTNEVRTQVTDRVEQQRGRAASALRTTGEELSLLADHDQQSRLTAEIARLSSGRVVQVADYLDRVQPEDLLQQLRSGSGSLQDFARRRPVVFLAGMALAGVVVGRLTRSAVAANTGVDSDDRGYRPYVGGVTTMRDEPGALAYGSTGTTGAPYPGTPYAGTGYGDAGYTGAASTAGAYPDPVTSDTTYTDTTYTDATAGAPSTYGAGAADPYAPSGTTYTGITVGDEPLADDRDALGGSGREGTARDV